MSFYPPISTDAEWGLGIILQHMQQDQGYLNAADCPYSDDLKKALGRVEKRAVAVQEEVGKWEKLEQESRDLYDQLVAAGVGISAAESAEKMAYFRVATALLEKLVSIQERTLNLRQVGKFHAEVMSIMEEILDASQRTAVLTRLEGAISNGV